MNIDYDILPLQSVGPPPKVSVWMITYNHEDYIGQALNSIIKQETSFPFEIVIGEDCSLDGTRQVLLHYQSKHPDVIRLLLWRKNAGMMANCARTLEVCRGEYIAFCEGDDYWTDPQKLQRQVDLLDSRSELALCHHRVSYVEYKSGKKVVIRTFPPESHRGTRRAKDFIKGNFIQTCSLMIRKRYLPTLDTQFLSLRLGDWPLCYLVAQNGDIGYTDRNMADYRIHKGNSWHNLESKVRSYEVVKMSLYLAKASRQSELQVAWRDHGLNALKYTLEKQSLWESWRQAPSIWKSGSLSSLQCIAVLADQALNRSKQILHRYPRVRTFIKRILFMKRSLI